MFLRSRARAILLVPVAGAAIATSAGAAPVQAQATSQPCAADCFVLNAVSIQGVTVYPLADLSTTYEAYLARSIGVDDLVRIAAAITDKYRSDGYFLSRAVVAPHDPLSGAATIVVYEGYFSEVEITGAGASAVRPVLDPLARLRPVRIRDLDRRLALATDVPGIQLSSTIEPVLGDPAQHRLVIEADQDEYSARVYIDNRGSDAQGPWQAYATTSLNGVATRGDQLTLSALTTPEQTEELTFAEAAYSTGLGEGRRIRGAVSGYTSNAPPGSTNGWLSGRSAAASVNFAQTLVRTRRQSLWLNGGLDVRQVRQTYASIGLAEERLSVARLSLSGNTQFRGANLSGYVQASQGLEIFGATTANSPDLTRSDADGVFTKFAFNLSAYRDIGRYAGVYGQVAGQWSGDPLLNSEEFGVGGSTFGRGYNYGEITGDSGLAAAVELRVGWNPDGDAISFLQLFAFLEAATVSNHQGQGLRTDDLASAGVGTRITLREKTVLSVELAKPMTRAPYTETDNGWRAFVALSQGF